jgi:hypothetical protein
MAVLAGHREWIKWTYFVEKVACRDGALLIHFSG